MELSSQFLSFDHPNIFQAGELLSAVFRLGIYSNVPATQHINAAIARLNVQGSS